MKRLIKFWGWEDVFVNTKLYCCKHLVFLNGFQCSLHYHKLKDETFYILKGKVKLELNGKTFILKEGQQKHIPINSPHRIIAKYGKAVILEISTKDRMTDSYRIEKSRKIERE